LGDANHEGMSELAGAAVGKAARATAPRSGHARWEPAPNRVDPVELLLEQARTRTPGLVPIRHGRMLNSPFAFFRGAAAIMAADRIAIAACLGGSDRFERALAAYAETYADQNERDHAALASAVRAGTIAAEPGR
jgi:hypothetical protein